MVSVSCLRNMGAIQASCWLIDALDEEAGTLG